MLKTNFAVYFCKKCLTHIYFNVKSYSYNQLSYQNCHYSLQYLTTYQIMEEDILNYIPNVMFRGTPYKSRVFIKSNCCILNLMCKNCLLIRSS